MTTKQKVAAPKATVTTAFKKKRNTEPAARHTPAKQKVAAPKAAVTTAFKKKRNTEPGIRHQGGRIYDSENGTSCHQCRQKTLEVKAPCKSSHCNLHWCTRCLSNRYNEEVDYVRHLPKWDCPKCRKICNCSNCRKKQGLQATGILANIARSAGFGSVSQLLEKNPNVSVMAVASSPGGQKKEKKKGENKNNNKKKKNGAARGLTAKAKPSSSISSISSKKKESKENAKTAATKKAVAAAAAAAAAAATAAAAVAPTTKASGKAADGVPCPPSSSPSSPPSPATHHRKRYGGVDDATLKKRRRALPAPVEPKIHSDEEGPLDIPPTVDTAKLVCVLEFFSTFAGTIGLEDLSVSALARELVREDAPGEPSHGNAGNAGHHVSSCLVDALVSLKGIICRWFGADEVDPDGLAWDAWLASRYNARADADGSIVISSQESQAPRGDNDHDHDPRETPMSSRRATKAPSAIARKPSPEALLGRRVKAYWPSEKEWFAGVVLKADRKGRAYVLYDDGDEAWEDASDSKTWAFDDQQRGPSFWSWSVADRLEAVYMVIHDAIQCGPIVDVIEKSVQEGSERQRLQKEIERVKRDISEEKERHKQRFIAELISSQQISNISAEKQREIVANARLTAASAVSVENMSRLRWLKTSQFLKNCPGRTSAVGEDRAGLSYYSVGCAEIITGSSQV